MYVSGAEISATLGYSKNGCTAHDRVVAVYALSKASAWPMRAEGGEAGERCVHDEVAPIHTQVSLGRPVSPSPPNKTISPRGLSKARAKSSANVASTRRWRRSTPRCR